MNNVDKIISKYHPLDSIEKVDTLVEEIEKIGVDLFSGVGLKIKFKITNERVLKYYEVKYFGITGIKEKIEENNPKKKHSKKRIFYGNKEQEEKIKKEKEERKKRLTTTKELWRKLKHKLPTVTISEEEVKYTDKAHIIYTPMGGLNKKY